jgi:hypothetical protein
MCLVGAYQPPPPPLLLLLLAELAGAGAVLLCSSLPDGVIAHQ